MIFNGYFQRLFGWGAPPAQVGGQVSAPLTQAAQSSSVTVDTALQVSTVFAATRLISETVASLPFDLYEKNESGRTVSSNQLRRVLTQRPNRYQTRIEFWESVVFNLVLSGNAYCVITRVGKDIASLMPVSSSLVTPELSHDGELTYRISNSTGEKIYKQSDIWHVKLFGSGIVGLSPLAHAAQQASIAQATNAMVADLYKNGGKSAGVLKTGRILTKEQRDKTRENFDEVCNGPAARLFILEADMDYQPTTITPKDLELISLMRYTVEDLGRFFGVPSILLNQTIGQSSLGSNVNEILTAFYKLNLRPYLEKIEESILRWLVPDAEKFEAEFDFDALLRADMPTRLESFGRAIQTGQMTPNEARHLEGRASLEGGDYLMIQSGTVPITSLTSQPDA